MGEDLKCAWEGAVKGDGQRGGGGGAQGRGLQTGVGWERALAFSGEGAVKGEGQRRRGGGAQGGGWKQGARGTGLRGYVAV